MAKITRQIEKYEQIYNSMHPDRGFLAERVFDVLENEWQQNSDANFWQGFINHIEFKTNLPKLPGQIEGQSFFDELRESMEPQVLHQVLYYTKQFLSNKKPPPKPKRSPLNYDSMFRDKDHTRQLITALKSPQCEKLDSSGKWQGSKMDLLGLMEFLIDNNYLLNRKKATVCRCLAEKFEAEKPSKPDQTVTADYVFQYDFLRNHFGNEPEPKFPK